MIDPAQGIPLVSVGIPTFNRLVGMQRALESVRAQDYPELEIIVSDNSSTDGTREYCEGVRDIDPRVSYIRHQANLGPERNFRAALDAARGEFFMWLADDDWIDSNYITSCVRNLVAHPDFVVVAGQTEYAETESDARVATNSSLVDQSPLNRVLNYYRNVLDNGVFYGVMRRSCIARLPIRRIMGSDWFIVASMAAWGKIATLPETVLHRSVGGASKDAASMIRLYGLTGWAAQQPFGVVAMNAARDILWRSPAHRERFRLGVRLGLSLKVYATIVGRYADLSPSPSARHNAWAAAHRAGFAIIRHLAPIRGAKQA